MKRPLPHSNRKRLIKISIAVIVILAIIGLRYRELHPGTSFIDVRTIVRIDTFSNAPFRYRLYYNEATHLQQGGVDINDEGFCVGDTFYIEGDTKTGKSNWRRWRQPKSGQRKIK
ncbi:MAG TPA: hypothetical protein VE978_17670 [Chitinophagales bacterium]|nr:hypothetical protein [Chitinophagales bacterium]